VISQSLGAEDIGGFARRSGYVNLETVVASRQRQLYPIGIKGVNVVIDE
jgi:hypothetical protein